MRKGRSSNVCWTMALLLCLVSLCALWSCAPSGGVKKKPPRKTCVDCHKEMAQKYKVGIVHAPVKKDQCSACHLPHGLIGGLFLRQNEPKLCLACHKDLRPSKLDASRHKPMKGKCTKCHSPHNSEYEKLLKTEKSKLCFECHREKGFKKTVVHAPVQQGGCDTCHLPHKSANKWLLTKKISTLCSQCHDVNKAEFKKSHFGYPVVSGCDQCHTPHSGEEKGLLKEDVHLPVKKGECDQCHFIGKDGRIGQKEQKDRQCLMCHKKESYKNGHIHSPYKEGKCTDCHAIHASDYKLLLASSPTTVCLKCHENKKKKATLSFHRPVREGDCLKCHNGHGSSQDLLLKSKEGQLCYQCHKQQDFGSKTLSHVVQADRPCSTCHSAHQSEFRYLLNKRQGDLCFSCHEKTREEWGKFSLHKPFATGQCTGCHKLHANRNRVFLIDRDEKALCSKCHQGVLEQQAEGFVPHAPVQRGQCLDCHAPHAADYRHVIKRPLGDLCLSCHQEVRSDLSLKDVHRPFVEKRCGSCHQAHGTIHKNILKKSQPVLCLECHTNIAKDWRDGTVHRPARESCLNCHGAHGSNHSSTLKVSKAELCNRCHDTNKKAFLAAHKQIRPGPNSCLGCHDPHGSIEKGLLFPVSHVPFEQGNCRPCHLRRSN